MTGHDVAVIGGGIIGASVALHLARAGAHDVVLCEQGMPAAQGATLHSGGLLRQHHTAYCDIELAVRGTRAFRTWADTIGGDSGYRRTGFAMLVDRKYADHLAENVAAVNVAGGDSRVLTPDELRVLHPGVRATEDMAVGYEPDGGYVDPRAATTSLLTAARRHGVRTTEGIRVTGIRSGGGRVNGVRTTMGDIAAGTVVVCAGAGSVALLAEAGVDLPLGPRRIGIAAAAAGHPDGSVPIGIDDTRGGYFRPAEAGRVYFGVPLSSEEDGAGATPSLVTEEEARASARRLAPLLPGLDGAPLVAARAGADLYSADRRPVIGPCGPDGLYLCTAFSGGGVKVAPAVGELVAAEIASGSAVAPLAPYRPQRFTSASRIESEFPYEHM